MSRRFQLINIENELIESRARSRGGKVDGKYVETMSRLAALERSLRALGSAADPELFRHFPVAAISVLETQFKFAIATLVDSGAPYFERGLGLCREKLTSAADVLVLLGRGRVSAGDLVAYLIPFNSVASLESAFSALVDEDFKNLIGRIALSVASLESAFSALVDEDFKNLIGRIEDHYFVRAKVGTGGPIVQSVSELWASLARTFERRHILAHESAGSFRVNYEDAELALASVAVFAKALDAMLWVTAWKDQPLTQYEALEASLAEFHEARNLLAQRLRKGLQIATEDGHRKRFRSMYFQWRAYSREWARWLDEGFSGGSIRPLVAARNGTFALKNQIDEMANWVSHKRFGDSPEPDYATSVSRQTSSVKQG